MEQLVLGLFQEQLSKVIIGFRKEQVNANLLNGKGEIRDVNLNCSLLNESFARLFPYVRLEEIHVSRIGFHVTSWTNLRRAPIIVDIGHVIARVEEPLGLLPPSELKVIQIITESELIKRLSEGFVPFSVGSSYGLADRIVDNMVVDLESFRLEFQTYGKFKTRRPGPWMPPLLQIEMKHIKACMVDPEGCEGTPDRVWAHNQGRRDNFLIYRKVQGECKIRLSPQDPSLNEQENGESYRDIASLKLEIQIATERRLRDGAVMACQFDVTIPEVDVDVDSRDVRQLAHFASGLQYCLAKDRSFEDPLKPFVKKDDLSSSLSSSSSPELSGDSDDSREIKDDFDSDSLDDSYSGTGDASSAEEDGSVSSRDSADEGAGAEDSSVAKEGSSSTHRSSTPSAKDRRRFERSVIVLPNNQIIYNSVTMTCSIHDIVLRGSYQGNGENAYLECVAKGFVAEAIWPKSNTERGMYVQLSTSFVSIQERIGHHKRTLLLGGMQRDDHLSRHLPSPKPREVCVDDFFPLFERRSLRDDPLDVRHLFPTQAFGLKTTIDFLEDKDDVTLGSFIVYHEVGVNEMDIVLDTAVFLRITRFIMGMDGQGFDPRWDTGDWIDLLTPDMLRNPSETLHLDECIQECTQIFLDENLMISSDLLNITARFANMEMRIPSAVQESLRSCNIILKWKETTFVVSSALPRTFLTGRIGNSISGDDRPDGATELIDFPNDPSDICYKYKDGLAGQGISTFRLQLTTLGFEVNIVPVVPFCTAPEPQKFVAIGESTSIFCFEGKAPTTGKNKTKITVFLSVLIQELILNIDFDLLAGATCTLLFHKKNIVDIIEIFGDSIIRSRDAPPDTNKIKKGMRGRRVLARRHMARSRETGGLVVIFCLQQRHFRLKVWRQNVPVGSPLRDNLRSANGSTNQHKEEFIDLLAIVDYGMRDLEIGIEFDFHSKSGHRTVMKSYITSANLKVVDLAREIENNVCRSREGTAIEDESAQPDLKDLCSFGSEQLPCGLEPSGRAQHFAFRLEAHHKNNSQSWSMAADVSAPSTVNLDAEAFRNATLLIIEALLLPSWSKDPIMENKTSVFPPNTVGALFDSVVAELVGDQSVAFLDLDSIEIDTNSCEPIVERVLRSICKMFFPSNLQVILLRAEIANLMISIPSENNGEEKKKSKLSFLLNMTDLITRFYPIHGSPPSEIEQVLACKGTDWSTLINTDKAGFYQSIFSRQSLFSMTEEEDGDILERVVHPFEIRLTYSGASVDLSMNKGIMIDDIRLIENIQSRLKSAVEISSERFAEIWTVLRAILDRDATKRSASELPITSSGVNKLNGGTKGQRKSSVVFEIRKLLEKANDEFSRYECDVRNSMKKKDDELESMKIKLFNKERERFGALSLISSRVAGWVRMGGQHRSGQRAVKKSMLWPFWAILRKELLILYSRPGEPKPSDIISLVNAKIHALSGGNSKQDTKRAFGIVESSGMIRYFVTGNAQEYELWTREINFAILSFSDATIQSSSENAIDDNASQSVGIGDQNDNPVRASIRNSGIGNRLSSAFQSARFRRGEMTDQTQSASSMDQSNHDDDSSILPNAVVEDSEADDGRSTTPTLDSGSATSRRAEFGKKLSGVGQVTKNRLGSALMNVRQKGAEISRRNLEYNPLSFSEADESVEEELGSAAADASTDTRNSSRGVEPSRDSTYSLSSSFRNRDTARQDVTNRRGSRFSFRRQQDDSLDDSLFGGELLTLKNIYIDERNSPPVNALDQQVKPLKVFKEKWIVVVSEIENSAASTLMETSTESPVTSMGQAEETSQNKHPESSNEEVDIERTDSDDHPKSKGYFPRFVVKVSQIKSVKAEEGLIVKQWSFGDVLKLYSNVSEAIEADLPRLVGKYSYGTDQACTPSAGRPPSAVQAEKVISWGRVLGGLLAAADHEDCTQGLRQYQCECIENFLNSLLECPLPIDAIMLLSESLGIDCATKSIESTIETDESNICASESVDDCEDSDTPKQDVFEKVETPKIPARNLGGSVLSLLSSCDAELQQFETKNGTVGEIQDPQAATNTEAAAIFRPIVYDPLIPPSLTDQVHESLHQALSNVIIERDEIHAQLIGTNVMHTHILERMRKKIERLELSATFSQEIARVQRLQDLQTPNLANMFGKADYRVEMLRNEIDRKIEKVHHVIRNDDGDAEMMQLCSQLAGEIATRTSNELEIQRLQTVRETERKTEAAEQEALRAELLAARELLERERTETAHWKLLYEQCQANNKDA